MEQQKRKIDISAGELMMATLVVIGAVITFWISTSVRLNALELRMNTSELVNLKIVEKLDKQAEILNEIRLALKDKQDKKQ